jgi:hypothetical protein
VSDECPEPTTPGLNATEAEWAAYFAAFAAYLECLAGHEGTTSVSTFAPSFSTFAAQAERFQNNLP